MKINCIVCAAEVDNWDIAHPDKDVVHPIGGTVFRTYGHYGSTVFDPMDASYLEIVVCAMTRAAILRVVEMIEKDGIQ